MGFMGQQEQRAGNAEDKWNGAVSSERLHMEMSASLHHGGPRFDSRVVRVQIGVEPACHASLGRQTTDVVSWVRCRAWQFLRSCDMRCAQSLLLLSGGRREYAICKRASA
jgi:hypothetical protein